MKTINNLSDKRFRLLIKFTYLLIIISISSCTYIKRFLNGRGDFQIVKKISKVSPYEDVRWKDLTEIESLLDSSILLTFRFNEKTVFPDKFKTYGNSLIVKGKNPGLGIQDLHKQGITGKGVTLAIIDQNICLDHPEYIGKIIEYHDVGCNQPSNKSSMHGPAVVSLLVGDSIGTAPDAKIYYVAVPTWNKDAKYLADALNWIIDKNSTLSEGDKIKAVSVSAVPSGSGTPFNKNNSSWDSAYSRAVKSGLIVIDCTELNGISYPCYYDIDRPDSISKILPGFPGQAHNLDSFKICVPNSQRTVAEVYDQGAYSYTFCGRAGISWAEPYLVGVLALGWQLNPDIPRQEMIRLLYSTSYHMAKGIKIIQPKVFCDSIKVYSKF